MPDSQGISTKIVQFENALVGRETGSLWVGQFLLEKCSAKTRHHRLELFKKNET
jgi:hypothetical protein